MNQIIKDLLERYMQMLAPARDGMLATIHIVDKQTAAELEKQIRRLQFMRYPLDDIVRLVAKQQNLSVEKAAETIREKIFLEMINSEELPIDKDIRFDQPIISAPEIRKAPEKAKVTGPVNSVIKPTAAFVQPAVKTLEQVEDVQTLNVNLLEQQIGATPRVSVTGEEVTETVEVAAATFPPIQLIDNANETHQEEPGSKATEPKLEPAVLEGGSFPSSFPQKSRPALKPRI